MYAWYSNCYVHTIMSRNNTNNINNNNNNDNIKVKTKGTPLWGTRRLKVLKRSFANITNVVGSAVD